jgi:hypothetical protein
MVKCWKSGARLASNLEKSILSMPCSKSVMTSNWPVAFGESGDRHEDERIGIFAAREHVGPEGSYQPVVAVAADERVHALESVDHIVAAAAVERVVLHVAGNSLCQIGPGHVLEVGGGGAWWGRAQTVAAILARAADAHRR